MMSARNFGIKMLVAAAFLVASDQVRASFVALPSDMGTLTTPGNYTGVGNYTYTFSGYSSTSSAPGFSIAASTVSVGAVTAPNPGFELTSPFAAPVPSQNDVAISYTVSTTGAGMTAVTLNANGAMVGGGLAQITETVYTDASRTTLLGQILVTVGTVTLDLKGSYKSLFITEDILFNTYKPGDVANFSIINQTFVVPEPASMAMLVLGLAGVGVFARRRGKANVAR